MEERHEKRGLTSEVPREKREEDSWAEMGLLKKSIGLSAHSMPRTGSKERRGGPVQRRKCFSPDDEARTVWC